MKQEFSSAFFEKDQHLADKPYIFYEDEERRSNLVRGKKAFSIIFYPFCFTAYFSLPIFSCRDF